MLPVLTAYCRLPTAYSLAVGFDGDDGGGRGVRLSACLPVASSVARRGGEELVGRLAVGRVAARADADRDAHAAPGPDVEVLGLDGAADALGDGRRHLPRSAGHD